METYESYSVMITDGQSGRTGTGTLFYAGGSQYFYVLTCAHVIYLAEAVDIHMLYTTEDGKTRDVSVSAGKDRFHFSPLDEPEVVETESRHTCDIAVIECDKGDLPLQPTRYAMCLLTGKDRIIAVGYPSSNEKKLYYKQSDIGGEVMRILNDADDFVIRVDGKDINTADREADLIGYSGSPVWDAIKLSENKYYLGGLIASCLDVNANGGRVRAMQSRMLQSLMKDEFGIIIESRLPFVPESEIAPGYEGSKIVADLQAVRAGWVENEERKVRMHLATLQLKKAAETAKAAIENSEFQKCTIEQKYSVYAVYLDSFRLARDYDIYEGIVEKMHEQGIRGKNECLRHAMRYFEAFELEEAKKYVEEALRINPNGNQERLLSLAIKLELDKDSTVSALSEVLGDDDQLLLKPVNQSEEVALYQMLGYILGNRFRETGRAIRCLNRAYQLGADPFVLETLGVVYYLHSVRNAFIDDESDLVDPLRIMQGEIEKARDALLRVFSLADEMWLRGMFRRAGLQIFKCFFFLHDNFRIYKHYKDVMKYFDFPDLKSKRDIQICYLDVAIRKEQIDLGTFDALTEQDRLYYGLIQLLNEPTRIFECGMLEDSELTEKKLLDILDDAEKRLYELKVFKNSDILAYDRLHVTLINLYGNGIIHYQWSASDKVKQHMAEIKEQSGKKACELYLRDLQCENPKQLEKEYLDLFERENTIIFFEELIRFYLRHGMIDKAREMYNSVFDERSYLMADLPEYFYRAYIDFIISNRLDLTSAIRCLVEKKKDFKDLYIYLSFEMDLNFATTTFNDPDGMLENSALLLEEGLLDQETYRRRCLIIHMLNCKPMAAEKYAAWTNGGDPRKGTLEEGELLAWKGAPIIENPYWVGMGWRDIEKAYKQYEEEEWLHDPREVLKKCDTEHNKTIVVDLWMLFILEMSQKLGCLQVFDVVYVTHSTIAMALLEIVNIRNEDVRSILAAFQIFTSFRFQSPTLEEQLEVRNPDYEFMEVHSACLLAKEMKCPALIGEFRFMIPEVLQANVIRPTGIEAALKCAGKK